VCLSKSAGLKQNPQEEHVAALSHQDQPNENVFASNHQKQDFIEPSELSEKDETYQLQCKEL